MFSITEFESFLKMLHLPFLRFPIFGKSRKGSDWCKQVKIWTKNAIVFSSKQREILLQKLMQHENFGRTNLKEIWVFFGKVTYPLLWWYKFVLYYRRSSQTIARARTHIRCLPAQWQLTTIRPCISALSRGKKRNKNLVRKP